MNLDHTPHPEIENHYHIRELIERQEKRTQDRIDYQNRAKAKEERDGTIKDNAILVAHDFYCTTCGDDFVGQAIKQTEVDWTNPTQNIAFYKTKCFKGHWCSRLITDKHKDYYFYRSKAVFRDRGKFSDSIIQPFETGYNLLYGKPR